MKVLKIAIFITLSQMCAFGEVPSPDEKGQVSVENNAQYVTLHAKSQVLELHTDEYINESIEYFYRSEIEPNTVQGMSFYDVERELGLGDQSDVVDTYGIIRSLLARGWKLIGVSSSGIKTETYHFMRPVTD